MIDTHKYQTMEAIEELSDEYDIAVASLDAEIFLYARRIQTLETKLKMDKPTIVKGVGYKRLFVFKNEAHFLELKKITYQHYQEGLRERQLNIKRGEE